MSGHREKCEQNVRNFAYGLSLRLKANRLNESACEGLIESYVNSSKAIYPEWREAMKAAALEQLGLIP